MSFSDIMKLQVVPEKNEPMQSNKDTEYMLIAFHQMNQMDATRDSILQLNHAHTSLLWNSAALEQIQKNKKEFRGVVAVLSRGNLDEFHARLGLRKEDLFGRSPEGVRDIYISSLTEDVTRFIENLWTAVKQSVQQVYDWSINLSSENTKIALCKKLIEETNAVLASKGSISVSCDMTDPDDWKRKVTECIALYTVLEELLTTATQSVISGQLSEKTLQDQLLGKMQRANIEEIKLNIQNDYKSSSFVFPGISSSRIELPNAQEAIGQYQNLMNNLLQKIDEVNKLIPAYAQNVNAAQTQYKCNTDCVAVVSNISSATQLVSKTIVSINSYVQETIANGLIDILSKVSTAAKSLPDQVSQTSQPAPEPTSPPVDNNSVTPQEPASTPAPANA